MTLKAHIDDIRNGLETGQFPNEASVSHGIVLRLLDALAWPKYNTSETGQVIIPEYSVGGRRVDYALCYPSSKPLVFIEVKRGGNIKGAEQQLFEYAFHEGVPIAILTDGQKWRFFYSMGQGDYRERQVCELDLLEGNSEENVKRLTRYLNYEAIRKDEAVDAIRNDYENVRQQRQVEAHLPEAWSKLLKEEEEEAFLLDVVADKVESMCGVKPTSERVLAFLKSLKRETELVPRAAPRPISNPGLTTRHRKAPTQQTRLVVTMPNGEQIAHRHATETLAGVLLELIEMLGPELVINADPEGMLISTSPFDRDRPYQQHGQYYISKNYGTHQKKYLLERLADRLNVQLQVEIVEKS